MRATLESSPLPALPSTRTRWLLAASVILLLLLIYGRSLGDQFVSWNDPSLIYKNEIVNHPSPQTIEMAFTRFDPELYIPLTFLSYQVDYLIGGMHPFIYRLDNLVLHALNVLLVCWLVYLLSESSWVALFCALLFAVHPLNTETVVWASARKDLLSSLFFLCSLISYIYYKGKNRSLFYILSIAFFLLALFSKVMVITLPLILLLSDYRKGRRWTWKLLAEKIPYGVLMLIFGVIAWFGKRVNLAVSTVPQKILISLKSIAFYSGKLLFPYHLSVIYPYNGSIRLFSPDILLSLGIVLLLLFLIGKAWVRNRELIFGLVFFLITLCPTLPNFYHNQDLSFAADHYAYLPSIGFLYSIVLAIYWFCRHESRLHLLRYGSAVLAMTAGLFGYTAYTQAKVWHDSETLFNNTLRYYPDALSARMNLATLYLNSNRIDDAMTQVKALLLLPPRGRTHRLLGDIYLEENQLVQAENEYRTSISMDPDNPEFYVRLGDLFTAKKDLTAAEDEYKKAIAIDKTFVSAHDSLSIVDLWQNKFTDAESEAREVISLEPFSCRGHYLLGLSLEGEHKTAEANTEYDTAVKLEPTNVNVLTSLASLYADSGKQQEGLALLKRAYSINPTDPNIQALARALLQTGTISVTK